MLTDLPRLSYYAAEFALATAAWLAIDIIQ